MSGINGNNIYFVFCSANLRVLIPAKRRLKNSPSNTVFPLRHFVTEVDGFAVNDKRAIAFGMKGTLFLAVGIVPCLDSFENEEMQAVGIRFFPDNALDIGQAFGNQRCRHLLPLQGCQAKPLELVNVFTGTVADVNHRFHHVRRRDGKNAFAGFE